MSGISKALPEGLDDLYHEVIVDHFKRPRFKGRQSACQFCQEGKNPLCGDEIRLYCQRVCPVGTSEDQARIFLSFEGSGCSISQASASMMCEAVQGLTLPDVRQLMEKAEGIYTGRISGHGDLDEDLEALQGVSQFPVRIKCAALPWKTLEMMVAEQLDCQNSEQCPLLSDKSKTKRKSLRIVNTK